MSIGSREMTEKAHDVRGHPPLGHQNLMVTVQFTKASKGNPFRDLETINLNEKRSSVTTIPGISPGGFPPRPSQFFPHSYFFGHLQRVALEFINLRQPPFPACRLKGPFGPNGMQASPKAFRPLDLPIDPDESIWLGWLPQEFACSGL
jgi:hypothetical protein